MNFLKKRNLLFLLFINISGIIVADDEIIKIIPIKANTFCEAISEGELVPLTRIPPRYPRNALLRGTEGYVSMQLCVDESGSVLSAIVKESRPSTVFNAAAIQAVLKWKFKPRVEGGVAIKQRGITRIDFQI